MNEPQACKPSGLGTALVSFLCILTAGACEPVTTALRESRDPVVITVNVHHTHQTMEGFGASCRVWDDPHVSNAPSSDVPREAQETLLALLYEDLGLSRVRLILDAGIEVMNDNDDPATFNWDGYNFQWKRNDAHAGFVRQARARGLDTFLTAPVHLEQWMAEDNPDEYVEWALAILLRWRELGLEMPYFSVINEPGHPFSGLWSPEWMQTVVKRLGVRMRTEGLRTKLVIPDDLNPGEAYPRALAVLNDAEARQYVGAIAYHLYDAKDQDLASIRDLSMQYRMPVWMTEFSVPEDQTYSGAMEWIKIVHTLIALYQVSAVDYMWAFFGSWDQGHAIVNVDFEDGRYVGHHAGPLYYLIGQFSRFVRPGYVRVSAQSTEASILVTAYQVEGRLVIVAINASGEDRRADITVDGMTMPAFVSATFTTSKQPWKELPVVPSSRSGFHTVLLADSVTTFRGASQSSASLVGPAHAERNLQ
jgi:O-glycosyl hydrolase